MLAISIPKGTFRVDLNNLSQYHDWQNQYLQMLDKFNASTHNPEQYQLINSHFYIYKALIVHEALKSGFNHQDFPSLHRTILCSDGSFMVNGVKFGYIIDAFHNVERKDIDVELNPRLLDQQIRYFIHAYLDYEESLVYFDGIQLASLMQQTLKRYESTYIFRYNPFNGTFWDIQRLIHGLFSPYHLPF